MSMRLIATESVRMVNASCQRLTDEAPPQTISFRANALNSRGIVGAGNPARFAPNSWSSGGDSNRMSLADALDPFGRDHQAKTRRGGFFVFNRDVLALGTAGVRNRRTPATRVGGNSWMTSRRRQSPRLLGAEDDRFPFWRPCLSLSALPPAPRGRRAVF
jgi:hypothetical protein